MTARRIRIATRESPLAMWQAEHVAAALRDAHPGIEVTLLPMTTTGDRNLQGALSSVGGKGLFLKELEQALLDDEADIAVHSMKDVPVEFPEGLELGVVLASADPQDAFVSNHFDDLSVLPQGATLGTSSLRRRCQIQASRPDLDIQPLRGNVNTRLKKLDDGDFDAIVLACAGLQRLGFDSRIRSAIPTELCVPAVGQGIVGIEQRRGDDPIFERIRVLGDAASTTRITAERAMNQVLGGSCQAPIAGHAVLEGDRLSMTGLVGSPDGREILRESASGPADAPVELGTRVARQLIDAGADRILEAAGHAPSVT